MSHYLTNVSPVSPSSILLRSAQEVAEADKPETTEKPASKRPRGRPPEKATSNATREASTSSSSSKSKTKTPPASKAKPKKAVKPKQQKEDDDLNADKMTSEKWRELEKFAMGMGFMD